jgi:membrane fusion protein (multidrug efflux system)
MNRKLFIAGGALVVLIGLGWGLRVWIHGLYHVTTDDAYVDGSISQIASKVGGNVLEVRVVDNQVVKEGELIVRLDPRDLTAKRDQARAAVAVAEAAVRSARSDLPLTREVTRAQGDEARAVMEGSRVAEESSRAMVEEARARVEARRAAVAALRAEVAGAESTWRQADRDRERIRRLAKDGLVAERDFDQAEMTAQTSAATLEAARRRLSQAEREVNQVEAEVNSRLQLVAQARERVTEAKAAQARVEGQRHQVTMKEADLVRAEARLTETKADLAFADLQLQHTEIRAPVDGTVSKKSVEIGQVVQVGQPLLAIVPLQSVWVVANYKETQLQRVRAGMPAEVEIDTYPGKTFRGKVDSISAGTGARFSLLPPENATGNWVKVVQRIPVKVVLDPKEVGNPHTLRAGMSAVVTIRVK